MGRGGWDKYHEDSKLIQYRALRTCSYSAERPSGGWASPWPSDPVLDKMCSHMHISHMAFGLAQDLGRWCRPRASATPGLSCCPTSAGSHLLPLLEPLNPTGVWGGAGCFVLVIRISQWSIIWGLVTKSWRILIFHPRWDTFENKKNYPGTGRLKWPVRREMHIYSTSEFGTFLVVVHCKCCLLRARQLEGTFKKSISFHLSASWGECLFLGPLKRKPGPSLRGEAFLLLAFMAANISVALVPSQREM